MENVKIHLEDWKIDLEHKRLIRISDGKIKKMENEDEVDHYRSIERGFNY